MLHRFLMTGVLFVVVALGVSQPLTARPLPESRSFDVAGRVVDELSGRGLAGVQVHVVGARLGTITDREGRYWLRGIPSANQTLRAQHRGYIPEQREIWLCRPGIPPSGACAADAAEGQVLDFYLRSAPLSRE